MQDTSPSIDGAAVTLARMKTDPSIYTFLATDPEAFRRRFDELGWGLDVQTRSDGLVTRTRNIFASQMVRSDAYTHLLMVDADIGFE